MGPTSQSHQLKDKLRQMQGPANTPPAAGKAVFGSNVGGNEPQVVAPAPPTGDIKASVPKVASGDPLVNGSTGAAGTTVADSTNKSGELVSDNLVQSPEDLFTEQEVILTEDERNAFLDALVSGKRYERSFTLFNGRIKGRLRCRSTAESEALAAWMNLGVREGKFKAPLEYALELRNALLASQVMVLNDVRYPELAQPLYRTKDGEKTSEPGWLKAAAEWSKQPEPIVAGVYEELRMFERKYWTMVVHARDQNFWRPAEST